MCLMLDSCLPRASACRALFDVSCTRVPSAAHVFVRKLRIPFLIFQRREGISHVTVCESSVATHTVPAAAAVPAST